jgi:hypothetical protein
MVCLQAGHGATGNGNLPARTSGHCVSVRLLCCCLHANRCSCVADTLGIKLSSTLSLLLSSSLFVVYLTTLLLVLYGCESWSPTLREEHRLRAFGNRVLRRIFGPKMDEMAGGWRKLHNEELHNLCSSPNIIRMIRHSWDEMSRPCSMYGGEEECIHDFGRKSRRKATTKET